MPLDVRRCANATSSLHNSTNFCDYHALRCRLPDFVGGGCGTGLGDRHCCCVIDAWYVFRLLCVDICCVVCFWHQHPATQPRARFPVCPRQGTTSGGFAPTRPIGPNSWYASSLSTRAASCESDCCCLRWCSRIGRRLRRYLRELERS